MEATLGILMPFLTAVLILAIIFTSKILRDRSKNRLIEKAIEHGRELSPDLFKGNERPKLPKDPLTSSLVTIGAGIAIFIALYLFFDNQLKFAAFGLIPLFVGLGQLAGYLINRKNANKAG
ncbi:MAG: hypothetical protein BGO30_10875 [Bacteroidetes bacterium 41-46]|nr:MAG: hypothetical protein BGO30_10875 [Bacteroidetes bacterium 41-46]